MRTKAYKRLLTRGAESGEIPADIAAEVLRQIDERGKMTPEIYADFTERLAERGLYSTYTTPYNDQAAPITGDHKYESKNFFYKIFKGIILGIYYTLGVWLVRIGYGLRVKGRKNLPKRKQAAVTVSNHFSYLDILCVITALGRRPMKAVVAAHNAGGSSALGRALFRAAGMVPLASSLSAARNFNAYLDACVKKGKLIHFYAERAMWLNYPKPRPLLSGAFSLAAKNGIPVVPVFFAYRKKGWLRRLLHMHAPMTAYILPPLAPDMSLPVKARAEALCHAAEAAMEQAYAASIV